MTKPLKIAIDIVCLLPFVAAIACVFAVGEDLPNGIVQGKRFVFSWVMLAVPLAGLLSFIVHRKAVRWGAIDYLLFAFVVLGLVLGYFKAVDLQAFKPMLLVLLLVFYLSLRILLSQQKFFSQWLELSIILVACSQAVLGLLQLYGFESSHHNLFKITGTLFNPGPFAGFLSIVAPLAVCNLLLDWRITNIRFHRPLWFRYLRLGISLATLVSILLVLPATLSRASWLASFGACFVVLVLHSKSNRLVREYIMLLWRQYRKLLVVAIIAVALIIPIGVVGMYQLKKDSADGRALMWKVATVAIADHPLGVGIGNFGGAYGEAQANYFMSVERSQQEQMLAGAPEYAFNEYLQIAVEYGLIGLLIFLSILLAAIVNGYRKKTFGVVSSIIALAIFALMSYPLSILPIVVVFVSLLSLAQNERGIKASSKAAGINLSLLILGILIVVYMHNGMLQKHKALHEWSVLGYDYSIGRYAKSLEGYKQNYPFLNDNAVFLFEYAQCLSKTEQYDASNEILKQAMRLSSDPMPLNIMGKNYQAMQQYAEAEQCFLRASHMVPNRLYPSYLLFNLYVADGNVVAAKAVATQALSKPIKIDSPAIQEMREHMQSVSRSLLN